VANYFAKALEEDEVEDLKTFFESLDENHDGVITLEEFKKGMKERDKKMTEEQIEKMFYNIDIDDSRGITLEELLTVAASRHLIAEEERMFRAFLDLDKDSSGTLSKEELQDAMARLNPTFNDPSFKRQISSAFAGADRNNDGVIDYEEFLRVLHPEFKEDQKLNEFVRGNEMYYAGANFDVVGFSPQERNREVSFLVPDGAKKQFQRIASSQTVVVDLNVAKEVEFMYNNISVTLTTAELLQILEIV